MSFYSAESQRKTFETEAFLFFVSCMRGTLQLISCWILSGSPNGLWSSHAALISEEKYHLKVEKQKHFVLLFTAEEMSPSVVFN